jgi:hypothetical protein
MRDWLSYAQCGNNLVAAFHQDRLLLDQQNFKITLAVVTEVLLLPNSCIEEVF